MKFSTLMLTAIPAITSASVVVLNDKNYETVTSEKPLAFIKFFAPWCGHCKAMAEDWIELGKALAEEKPDLLIAEVDCTSEEATETCNKNGIEGFPTLMYGDPDFLESYEGSREFDELYVFATSGGLKASCSPKNIQLCDEEEKSKMEKYLEMSIEDLQKAVDDVDEKMAEAEKEFDKSTDFLEEEYMGMMEETRKTKESAKKESNYSILKGVQSIKEQAMNDKDEL